MIKANELRIGNWVRHKPLWSYRQDIPEYKEFDFKWSETDWYQRGEFCISFEDVKPIQITEEWLLKFGFKEIHVRDIKYYVLHGISLISDGANGYLMQLGKGFTVYVDKVHHLQNLYFALTQKELEFKE